ncbi:helix-turn-helix domain-containing protein [Anaerovorax odorimutans]|uniref:helix-turn-helix domain-containing protein n=1 Tax=Anaerovorax odorimutans TaxID=109327 RepID=UPI00042363EB|nr:helix-turn-helix transcriptional regulator [Anaerovorax odorimutans]
MTLGEKLLQLRKSKNISQEKLALKLSVSRQAISKWELGESMPDTYNVVQLSKLFGVSIDYLLNDEINDIENNSQNIIKQKNLLKQIKFISKISISIEIIALILAFLFILFEYTHYESVNLVFNEVILKVGICFLFQILSIILFEIFYDKDKLEEKQIHIKEYFYTASIWLIMPIPIIYLGFFSFPIIRRPITFWTDILYLLIPYIVICIILMLYLKIQKLKR